MKFFDKFSRASFAAIVIIIIGGIIEIVALASPYWNLTSAPIFGKIGHTGLWLTCKRVVAAVLTTSCAGFVDGIAGPHSEDGYGLSPAKRISKVGAVAIFLLFIAWILELVAVCSPHWVILFFRDVNAFGLPVTVRDSQGLWTSCSGVFAFFPMCEDSRGWLVAVRALNVIGMMFGSGALVFMGLFTFLNSEKYDKIFKSSAISSAILAGVLIIIAAIVYGASVSEGKAVVPYRTVTTTYTHKLSWAFGLSIVAAIFCVISGVVMGFARKPRTVS